MTDYRIEAATKEEWAERALRAERKLADTAIDYEKLRRRWAEVAQSKYQRAKSAEAKLAKAVEALREIARQKKTDELETEYDVEVADFEGGYDLCIDRARATLAELKGQGDEWKCPINYTGCTKNCGSYGCGN
jgi:thioredoxin-like negative regulator of GroEL